MSNRNNAFDLIRHFAALLVLFSHHFALSKLPEPMFLGWQAYGFVGVVIFFSISGFVMPASFHNSPDFIGFMGKRFRRIFPGLIVCTFIINYVIGPLFTNESAIHYLKQPSTFENFLKWSVFIGEPIPGVFSDFLRPNEIDGSLWTLPVEFMCYVIFGIVLSFSKTTKAVLVLFIASCIATAAFSHSGANYWFFSVPMDYLALQGIAFTMGALMSMTYPSWSRARIPIALLSIAGIVLFRHRPEMPIIGTACLAVLTIVIGTSFKDKIIRGRFDISYGMYIYAFLIQQLVINLTKAGFWPSMAISIALTILAGYLSYRYVEKPFLRKHPSPERTPEQFESSNIRKIG
jgi:peptidoglycan/LPS O-acetylase OafA/YrhL